MAAKLVSRSEYAETAGVSPAAITKACKGALAAACVNDRIDLNHEDARAYLIRKGVELDEIDDWPPADLDPDPGGERIRDIGAYMDMTLREILERFGTERAFKDFLEAGNKIENLREKRLNIDERQRTLISRELVKTHVFGTLDAGNRRLLTDTPRTITQRLYAAAKGGVSIEEAEKTVREILESQLAPVKAAAARLLRKG